MFEASIAPSAPPAPTMVWISSINKIMSGLSSSSLIKVFIFSSNSPRYLVPDTNENIFKEIIFLSFKNEGHLSLTIKFAIPSTIAVLPTPAGPIKIGLFFFLLSNISITLSISFSLPITGSNFFSLARRVKSVPCSSRRSFFLLLFLLFFFILKS